MSDQPTKQHILESTINAIEKYGIQNLTTRIIAQEAGVNNAALHYYYGTKERLLGEALSLTLSHMLEDTEEILTSDTDIRARLIAVFTYLVEGILRFPNLIRAHIQGPLMEGKPNSAFVGMLDAWLNQTYQELSKVVPQEKRSGIRHTMHAAISSILFAGLMTTLPDGVAQIDLRDEETRLQYIQNLIEPVLHDAVE